MKKIILLLSLVLLLSACGSKEGAKSGDGKLVIWGFFEGMPKKALDNWAKETGKEVEYQTIAWADYKTKLNTVVGTKDAPDIVLLERSFMGQYLPTDAFLTISEEWKDKPEMQTYLKNTDNGVLGQASVNGIVKAVGWENTSGAFFYRSDMAKEMLGINSPEEMEKLIATEEDFIKLMTKFTKEHKDVKFMTRNSLAQIQLTLNGGYQLNDEGAYVISNELKKSLKNVKTLYDMNYFYVPIYEKTAILNGAKTDKFFSALEPAWAVQEFKEWDQPNKWAIANPPFKWVTGGTFMAVSNTADKDLVWDFFAKTFLNESWLVENMEGFGMIANSKIMDTYLNNSNVAGNPYFSDQNTVKKFAEISASIDTVIPATQYDSGISKTIEDITDGLTTDKTISDVNEAVAKIQEELKSLYPDLKIIVE